MKSRINLYHNEFRPKFEWITAPHLALSSLLALCIGMSIYCGLYYWQQQTKLLADQLNVAISQQQRNIEEFTVALQSRKGDPALTAQLNQMQSERLAQETLLLRVKDMSQLKQKSFSTLFDALSSSNSNSLWLTSFTVNEADLTIRGNLAKPSALTQWITQLSKTEFFKGQEFDDAKLVREDGQLIFELSSVVKRDALLAANGGNDESN